MTFNYCHWPCSDSFTWMVNYKSKISSSSPLFIFLINVICSCRLLVGCVTIHLLTNVIKAFHCKTIYVET